MGYMRHHAIVVTTWKDEAIEAAWKAAEDMGNFVTTITPPAQNGYRTFVVVPDGSKEGWDRSDEGDSCRGEFIRWLREQAFEDGSSYYDWVEVQFGDDYLETRVTDDSDRLRRAEQREREGQAV